MIQIVIRIPESLKRDIDRHKANTGVPISYFTMKALEEKLSREVAA